MKAVERIELIDRLGRELQSRYRYDEIDAYLAAYKIAPPKEVTANSKWVYSKEALKGVDSKILTEMAEELGVAGSVNFFALQPPVVWPDSEKFRLFISHLARDADKAMRLKDALSTYNIAGFVAHEDIMPTKEWQAEIERALGHMDAMLAIHTKGFSASYWTQQEVGFALGARKKIISFKMPEDPTGFIQKNQAIYRKGRMAEAVAEEVYQLLLQDEKTADRINDVYSPQSELGDSSEIPF